MARRFLSALLPIGFWLCLASHALQAQSAFTPSSVTTPAMPREERLKVFDQVWRAIYENYYDKRFHGSDWQAVRSEFRPEAEAVTNSVELYRILRRMIGRLGDAHTKIYAPNESFDRYKPTGTTVGVVVRRIEGRPTVTWVEPGSEAARQGIRPGFRVLEVDHTPIEKALERIRNEIGESSTPTALNLQSFDRIFSGDRDTSVSVDLTDGEGNSRAVTLTRRFVEFQRRVTSRQLPFRIGYIEVTGFGPEIEKDFEYAMQSMQGAQGLILDLRNNGGGFVTTVAQVSSYFFLEETNLGEFISRQGRATARQTQKVKSVYLDPLVVLVSSRSASGAEIFAATMQERKRALIIGANPATCGCLLGVSRTLKLADGGKLNISDTDYRTALGRRIEGSGVKPDQQFTVRTADLLDGRDRTLEAAVDLLSRIIAFGNRSSAIEFKLKLPGFNTRIVNLNSPTSYLN